LFFSQKDAPTPMFRSLVKQMRHPPFWWSGRATLFVVSLIELHAADSGLNRWQHINGRVVDEL
jgi:hypothetical protein